MELTLFIYCNIDNVKLYFNGANGLSLLNYKSFIVKQNLMKRLGSRQAYHFVHNTNFLPANFTRPRFFGQNQSKSHHSTVAFGSLK